MPIAELFLGALLPVLFERLASRELLDFARREGIHKLLKKWEELLISIDKVLYDAEDRQLSGDPDVEPWLKDLRNLAYDIDDLLDEFATKSAEKKSKAEPDCSKVRSLLPSCCFRSSSCAIMFDCKMKSKIEEMDSRLREIITKKERLRLSENNRESSGYRRQDKPDSTTSLTEACFVSREDDKKNILNLLIGEEDDQATAYLKVIPIVGMGGVGKTALTQQVYNDLKVAAYFNVKAWVCVSDVLDVPTVTKCILEEICKHLSCKDKDLNWLQNVLKENLMAKKFLIVLDDVWNEDYEKWTLLLKPFQSGAKGSKILLTTRNMGVASLANAPSYDLRELSTDASMTMFAYHATKTGNFDHCPELEVLGRQIVAKCQGLPLAVKTLAGLLRSKDTQGWEEVLNSKIWNLPEGRNKILPSLKLSYLHLPSNLRRCFAYCAIFPKDYEIERDELIRWWSAEGLLEGKGGMNHWNVGLSCFDELVSRSLFQKSSNNGSRFLMHDLVNDLAKLVAGGSYFGSGELEPEVDQNDAFLARHASVIFNNYIVPKRFKKYHKMKGLRSFISLAEVPYPWSSICLSQKVLLDLLSALKCLRVLSLSHYRIKEILDCVGKLRHLRHLNLSYTNIETLPKSIVGLFNLEDLMLRGCRNLVKLPNDMEKLINMRFLDITDTPKLRAMPPCVGNMVGLEMLSKFVVETKTRSRLDELKNLQNLEGDLCIYNLHKVRAAKDAADANLCMKEGICRLTMQWCEGFEDSRDEELEAEVLNHLLPPKKLENLTISFFGALKFPSWLGSPLYVNMVHIRLHGCRRAEALPSLGQLTSLKELYIEGLNAICKVGSEFYGVENPFSSLITLEFKDLPLWEDWSHCISIDEEGVLFPRLEHLVIENCPKLIGRLPSQLSPLIELRISHCPRMDASPPIIRLPSLKKLNFRGCNEGVLKSLVNLTSLTKLVLSEVAELTCLNHGFTSSLIGLEKLEMEGCGNLLYLWEDRDVAQNLACLTRLDVKNCPNFMSFVVGEGDIELPGKLETMHFSNCINLEKLPSNMHTLCSLRVLSVEGCPKLVSFPKVGIPRSMTSLRIEDCEMLQYLPIGVSTHPNESSSSSSYHSDSNTSSCLQELTIRNCGSLGASPFSEGRFLPATFKRLKIWRCNGVESLAEINADRLRLLQEIQIWDCENLRSLPEGLCTLTNLSSLVLHGCPALELECVPPLPPSITSIELQRCPKIKSLPNQLHRLTCLCDLKIVGCEGITCFPDGGLPPQLRRLVVMGCGNMKQPVREWLTPGLTSLEDLHIDGRAGGVGEGVDLVLPLPPSLLSLVIQDMGKVERVACSLPPSLCLLYFDNCPKLRELPRDGLPPSLEEFKIKGGCGVLKKRCRKGSGSYWPLLREIPDVELWDSKWG